MDFNTVNTKIIDSYRKAKNRLILLDYDGTLVHFDTVPERAVPTPYIKNLLHNLNLQARTQVAIITGRSYLSIEHFLGNLNLDMIADHGAMVKENNQWRPKIENNHHWKPYILEILDKWTQQYPGSFVESKSFSLAWHFRTLDGELDDSGVNRLKSELHEKVSEFELQIMNGDKVLEIMPTNLGKAKAAQYVMHRDSFDYILSIGDDASDEEIFELLSELEISHTVKVGSGKSAAKYHIQEIENVHRLLEEISK
ncbi:MAG: trehalose-phosphatase [Bacteroidetes bacterium]|nr:trehalose-phosphatase [Bacteroidota bacterium]